MNSGSLIRRWLPSRKLWKSSSCNKTGTTLRFRPSWCNGGHGSLVAFFRPSSSRSFRNEIHQSWRSACPFRRRRLQSRSRTSVTIRERIDSLRDCRWRRGGHLGRGTWTQQLSMEDSHWKRNVWIMFRGLLVLTQWACSNHSYEGSISSSSLRKDLPKLLKEEES